MGDPFQAYIPRPRYLTKVLKPIISKRLASYNCCKGLLSVYCFIYTKTFLKAFSKFHTEESESRQGEEGEGG